MCHFGPPFATTSLRSYIERIIAVWFYLLGEHARPYLPRWSPPSRSDLVSIVGEVIFSRVRSRLTRQMGLRHGEHLRFSRLYVKRGAT